MKKTGQIPVYLVCVIVAGLASFAFDPPTSTRFSAYGGGLPPISVLALCILAGVPALWQLDRTRFRPKASRKANLASFVALSLAFASVSVAVDLARPFPADLNARFPQSLLFYPAIAMVAETAFHLIPLALVFTLTRSASLAILAAALVEPAFQVAAGWTGDLHWSDAVVGLNILGISLVQLILFRRHGFATMLGFRLVYYLWWHILWGEARLALLF